jgi:hypothetical protein
MRLGRVSLLLGAGLLSSLALVASAAGTTSAHIQKKHLQVAVAALAMDGYRIAYDASPRLSTKPNAANKVLVWNVRTGKTVKVSGKKTAAADTSSTGAGVFQLAIAGSRVAWLMNVGGNLEGDDYLFASSLTHPREHQVASEIRTGGDGCAGRDNRCAGEWLGGLVGSGSLIAGNRWTTDSNNTVTAGELDVLSGAKLKQVATGAGTVQAAVADGGRVAVLRADRTVALYSARGRLLLTVPTPPSAEALALQGERLVVGDKTQQLLVYDARTGSLRKTLPAAGQAREAPRNLDVEGKIAIYTTDNAGELHAVNLSTGKDRIIAKPRGGVVLAQIDSAGLAYAGNGFGTHYGKGTLVFIPFAKVKAAVS